MTWYTVMCDGWKPHFVHESICGELILDGYLRNHPLLAKEKVQIGLIDKPGTILENRILMSIPIDGFTLKIPMAEVEFYLKELGNVRSFDDGSTYTKLHGWLHCIVLNKQQTEYVKNLLQESLESSLKVREEEELALIKTLSEANLVIANSK